MLIFYMNVYIFLPYSTAMRGFYNGVHGLYHVKRAIEEFVTSIWYCVRFTTKMLTLSFSKLEACKILKWISKFCRMGHN